MPFKTKYGSHYHMTQGCHGADIPCGTEGLTPCSDCCGGDTGKGGGASSLGAGAVAAPGSGGFEPVDEGQPVRSDGTVGLSLSTGAARAKETEGKDLPGGFEMPDLGAMAGGDVRCDHSCDVEHLQEVDGQKWVTSIIWTSDGGCGALDGKMIGCQWIGSVARYDDNAGWRDTGIEDRVEVILDCDADTPSDEAIRAVHALLGDAVRKHTRGRIDATDMASPAMSASQGAPLPAPSPDRIASDEIAGRLVGLGLDDITARSIDTHPSDAADVIAAIADGEPTHSEYGHDVPVSIDKADLMHMGSKRVLYRNGEERRLDPLPPAEVAAFVSYAASATGDGTAVTAEQLDAIIAAERAVKTDHRRYLEAEERRLRDEIERQRGILASRDEGVGKTRRRMRRNERRLEEIRAMRTNPAAKAPSVWDFANGGIRQNAIDKNWYEWPKTAGPAGRSEDEGPDRLAIPMSTLMSWAADAEENDYAFDYEEITDMALDYLEENKRIVRM